MWGLKSKRTVSQTIWIKGFKLSINDSYIIHLESGRYVTVWNIHDLASRTLVCAFFYIKMSEHIYNVEPCSEDVLDN